VITSIFILQRLRALRYQQSSGRGGRPFLHVSGRKATFEECDISVHVFSVLLCCGKFLSCFDVISLVNVFNRFARLVLRL